MVLVAYLSKLGYTECNVPGFACLSSSDFSSKACITHSTCNSPVLIALNTTRTSFSAPLSIKLLRAFLVFAFIFASLFRTLSPALITINLCLRRLNYICILHKKSSVFLLSFCKMYLWLATKIQIVNPAFSYIFSSFWLMIDGFHLL